MSTHVEWRGVAFKSRKNAPPLRRQDTWCNNFRRNTMLDGYVVGELSGENADICSRDVNVRVNEGDERSFD
jgi:hypothetical protein